VSEIKSWASQHALDNLRHVTHETLNGPAECLTCGEKDPSAYMLKPVSMEITLGEVSPEVMALLYGAPVEEVKPEPIFAIESWHPIKRTFWQWLRRKPRQWRRIYIPRARITTREESADGGSSDTP
jgi:hypothetical protein